MKKIVAQQVVGVDVSKEWLDIHIYPVDQNMRIDNTALGIQKLIDTLSVFHVNQVVCESSGGYESLLLGKMQDANYKTWRVDPRRIKAFRESEGIRAKTDKLDAKIIALFALKKQQPYVPHSQTTQELQLQSLVRRRDDIKYMIVAEKLRMDNPQQYCKSSIKRHILYLERELVAIDSDIDNEIENNEQWRKKRDLMQSVPGIGKKTIASLLADAPELGKIENKQAAALLGAAPFNQESGKRRGKAYSAGGRMGPRNVLYMAILSAAKCNPTIKAFYLRLRAAGKAPKVALIACMNKMIRILNAMLRNNQPWNEKSVDFA